MLLALYAIVHGEMRVGRVKPLAGVVCQHGTPCIRRGELWLSRWIFGGFSDIFKEIGPYAAHLFPVEDVIYAP